MKYAPSGAVRGRGLNRVGLHADRTILASLSGALACRRNLRRLLSGVSLSPKSPCLLSNPRGPCERLGGALTKGTRAADDLPVKLALGHTVFHASITAFRQTVLVVRSRRVGVAAIVRTERVRVGRGVIPPPGV